MKKIVLSGTILAVCLLVTSQLAFAHAVLVSSTPKINGTMHGPAISMNLKFNSRVDGTRSSLSLVLPGGGVQTLSLLKQAAPNELDAQAQLAPGKYTLRWQALAVDGHITRGEVPFTVN
jgi:copper resistance protein C